MPGVHNVLNTLAAIAVADELAVPYDIVRHSLATFDGVARRFTVTAVLDGVVFVDDYGHHPAEIRATLAAARRAYNGRVIAVFQPHRYTRTQSLFEEFTKAFNDCDQLVVIPVYPAGEQPIVGATGERLADAIAIHGHHSVRFVRDFSDTAALLAPLVRAGDVVIALGAGDVNKVLKLIQNEIVNRSENREGGT